MLGVGVGTVLHPLTNASRLKMSGDRKDGLYIMEVKDSP
jgi:hypothetical protein